MLANFDQPARWEQAVFGVLSVGVKLETQFVHRIDVIFFMSGKLMDFLANPVSWEFGSIYPELQIQVELDPGRPTIPDHGSACEPGFRAGANSHTAYFLQRRMAIRAANPKRAVSPAAACNTVLGCIPGITTLPSPYDWNSFPHLVCRAASTRLRPIKGYQ